MTPGFEDQQPAEVARSTRKIVAGVLLAGKSGNATAAIILHQADCEMLITKFSRGPQTAWEAAFLLDLKLLHTSVWGGGS